jgi:hypothetical protein
MTAILPTLVCIGAARSASTWLGRSCEGHPDMGWLPSEPRTLSQVFSNEGINGIAQAYAEFSGYPERGEKDPYYSTLSRAEVARIRKVLPDLRIIYLARNPADRAMSHISLLRKRFMDKRSARKYDTIWECLRLAESPIQTRLNDTYRTLEIWGSVYPASKILLIRHDDISLDTDGVLQRIADFAGVDAAGFRNPAARTKTTQTASYGYPEKPFLRYYLVRRWSGTVRRVQTDGRLDVTGWIEKNDRVLKAAPLRHRILYPLAALYFRHMDGSVRRLASAARRAWRLSRWQDQPPSSTAG